MTIGLWSQYMSIEKQKICMEFLNKGKVATQSQSKFDCLVKKEEHEQTTNIENYKNELCINFRRNIWWTSEKNNYSIVNMNSKMLYSHFIHEGKHNEKVKLGKTFT